MLKKNTLREIRNSLGRYLAIFAIVALGVGFFVGLKDCKESMLRTCNRYLTKTDFYDYQLTTSYGIDDESVEIAKAYKGVEYAEASIQQDVIVRAGKNDDEVNKVISLPEKLNMPQLKNGRMPKADNECVVDDYGLKAGFKIGDTLVISENNDEDTLKTFKYKEFKVVGTISTPLYLDYQRGSTTIGDGTIKSFFYVNKSAFDMDYYTQLYVKLSDDGGDGSDAASSDEASDNNIKDFFSDEAEKKLDDAEKSMKQLASNINDARRDSAMKKAQEELDEKKAEYEDNLYEYRSNLNKANSNKSDLQSKRKQVSDGITQAKAQATQLEQAIASGALDEQTKAQYEAQLEYINKTTIPGLEANLASIDSGLQQIDESKSKLDSAESKLADAKSKLDEAQEEIEDMEKGKSYVFTRYENSAFAVFEENAEIVDNIAKIFPAFFLLVAALVCMTTMTRMVDEQRNQIGILKALGYGNAAILGKFMFYSGSSAFLGAVVGFFGGSKLFPMVIWHAYTMMYNFDPDCVFVIDWQMGIAATAAALLCATGVTWASCAADFKVAPAELIRPKAPKAGKRILLERIKPIWSRVSFLWKVSLRNIFRYKKRALMMILGISGCTALLIAGLGINTTVKGVAKFQFDEIVHYDYILAFDKDMDEEAQAKFREYAGEDAGDMLFLHMANVDVVQDKSPYEITLVATDAKDIRKYFDLHYDGKDVDYPKDGEVVACEKLRQKFDLEIGDDLTIKSGYRKMTLKVSGFCDNYVDDYCFITPESYKQGFEKEAAIKTAVVRSPNKEDTQAIRDKASYLGKYDDVAATVVNADTIDTVDAMMESLNAIVLVVILCAGLLAFIVLFNLTNINITERIREVATIKVLGFNGREVSRYVFRENLVLTAIATLVGIPLGKWLLDFVISKICVNSIFFVARITTVDYLLAIVLTFVFAFIVNLAMRKRLRDISMTESLKSVD